MPVACVERRKVKFCNSFSTQCNVSAHDGCNCSSAIGKEASPLAAVVKEASQSRVVTGAVGDEEGTLVADDEVEIELAADTGGGVHRAYPRHLPDSVAVMSDKLRNSNGAAGGSITHYGRASVRMQQQDDKHISQEVQVREIVRPPHSISMVCGNDFGVVFTKT